MPRIRLNDGYGAKAARTAGYTFSNRNTIAKKNVGCNNNRSVPKTSGVRSTPVKIVDAK